MEFTNDWFVNHKQVWNQIIPQYHPQKILEIGSFEGQSICHMIENFGKEFPLEIYCLDTWEGGREHQEMNLSQLESRFDRNVAEAVNQTGLSHQIYKIKAESYLGLSMLISQGKSEYFDFVYIDGSHETPDVFSDAALSYRLLKMGGLMVFDDYVWGGGVESDPIQNPKMAIDCFLNCYQRKVQPHPWLPLCQVYCRKIG